MAVHHLQHIINIAESIARVCPAARSRKPLKTAGHCPQLNIPSEDWFLPKSMLISIDAQFVNHLWQRSFAVLKGEQKAVLDVFARSVKQFDSLEEHGGMLDSEVERQLCKMHEESFFQFCVQVRMTIQQCIESHQTQHLGICGKRSSSFTTSTITLLEAAYNRSQILSTAETALIAKAAGITPHQVRTWFQNKRNRGSKRNNTNSKTTSIQAPNQTNRPIQGLPKRAQQIKSKPSSSTFNNPASGGIGRQVRGLPRRAQVSHNAPTTSIIDSSLGNFPHFETTEYGHECSTTPRDNGERMNRSPSFTESLISNSTGTSELPNGRFTSPFNGQPTNPDININGGANVPQIAVEWGKGILNVPVDVLEGGKMPIFNFTPPSPLNMNFNPIFNGNTNINTNVNMNGNMGYSGGSVMGGQIYDTPSQETLYNPFSTMGMGIPQNSNNTDFGLDLSKGLESIESILSSALSDPSSFEQFQTTLAASPQFSLDSLSPRSDTLDSIPSLGAFSASGSGSGVSSPGWLGHLPTDAPESTTLDGGFFEALEGLLASSTNTSPGFSNGELGSPFDPSTFSPSRNVSISSQDSFGDFGNGIISANEGIDLSYIAGIPLPPSPTTSSLSLPTFENTPLSFPISSDEKTSMGFDHTEYIQQPSGMCTPSSTTSSYPLITPTTNPSQSNSEQMVEVNANQDQWNWIDGALPFDMVGMEVEMVEYGNGNGKLEDESNWMMGQVMGMMAV